jgi:hypothetical protein
LNVESGHDIGELSVLCKTLSEGLEFVFPNTQLHFILHRWGQHPDQIEKTLGRLVGHPAYHDAKALLKAKASTHGNSAFLGIAVSFERGLFGMSYTQNNLGFIAINVDQHQTREDLLFSLYHLTGQFMHLATSLNQIDHKENPGHIFQPRKNNLALSHANLKSDVFSALMMTHAGYDDAVRDLAKIRSLQSLTVQTTLRPEEYPFPISLDVTTYAAEKFRGGKNHLLRSAFDTSSHIAKSFDRDNLETWMNFTIPSQTMAWSGAPVEQILGAAVNTSPNPFIKATGLLVAEVTDIEPLTSENLPPGYNPFVDLEINQISHERQVGETFEMIMTHALEADSHLPLIRVANNQNEGLLKGRIMGWCAHALQAAARAFETASQRGIPPAQAARLEFQSAQQQIDWEHLYALGNHVIDRQRLGEGLTLSSLSAWCEKRGMEFRHIASSIDLTLDDSSFHSKLAMATDMPTPAPIVAPAAKPASTSPAPAVAAAPVSTPAPSLGGGYSPKNTPAMIAPSNMELEDD